MPKRKPLARPYANIPTVNLPLTGNAVRQSFGNGTLGVAGIKGKEKAVLGFQFNPILIGRRNENIVDT